MKKFLCAILSILLLVSVAVCCLNTDGGVAFARSQHNAIYNLKVGDRTVKIYTLELNDQPMGVRMNDVFFGNSDIPVQIDVYSSDNFVIDFAMDADVSTLSNVQLANRQALIDMFKSAVEIIERIDSLANTQYGGANGQTPSDVFRYNNASDPSLGAEVVDGGYKLQIAKETYEMLKYAQKMYLDTHYAFNPAVYRLVDLWGFSSRTYARDGNLPYDRTWNFDVYPYEYPLPAQEYVDAFSNSAFIDFSENAVSLADNGDGTYSVTKKVAPVTVGSESYEQWIDLGGIAKGYAVDKVREMIAALDIDRFFVNAGSSSMATGYEYDGNGTKLGMLDAFDEFAELYQTALLAFEVGKSSVSTSGQNIRKYVVDGVEYSHIIDGTKGAPAQTGVRSVMIIVPEEEGAYWATMGDCLTTALTVMDKDGIVNFANGYLKEHNVKIIVQYETLDGRKQLLTNYTQEEIEGNPQSNFPELGWALKLDENGNYYYDADAKFVNPKNTYTVLLAVLGSVLGVGAIALVVYHFVRGRNRVTTNVVNAKKDKPFKVLDVMVYVAVVLVVLVLFYVFLFDVDSAQMKMVNVVDDQTGETLFMYNVTRDEYTVNGDNQNGWVISVERVDGNIEVTLTRDFDGGVRFNKLKITRGATPSVEMTDSLCGYHQDCVRNFPALTRSGGAIVCSPNRLKIITA